MLGAARSRVPRSEAKPSEASVGRHDGAPASVAKGPRSTYGRDGRGARRLAARPASGLGAGAPHVADPAWIRLDADELLDEAQRSSGLSDFGGDDFLEPYRVFVRALDEEAKLHALGRADRAQRRAELAREPPAARRLAQAPARDRAPSAVREPIFITGLPRTGTSILHELLAQDPAHRVPLHWEVRHPVPAAGDASARRAIRASSAPSARCSSGTRSSPSTRPCTSSARALPVECIQLTAHEFLSEELLGRHQVPSYAAWYAGATCAPAYRFHRAHAPAPPVAPPARALGAEGAVAPRRARTLLRRLSGRAHRVDAPRSAPGAALGGEHPLLDRLGALRRGRSAALLGWFTGETCAALLDGMTRASRERRGRAEASSATCATPTWWRPLATIAALYDHFGIELSAEAEPRMRAYLAREAEGQARRAPLRVRGHRASTATPSASASGAYQERFGVPSEV